MGLNESTTRLVPAQTPPKRPALSSAPTSDFAGAEGGGQLSRAVTLI